MSNEQKTKLLRSMMKSYEGPQHIVVAFNTRHGESNFIASGMRSQETLCEDLIFEIGSITKVFTGILLCVLVEEGKVDPRAPLREMSSELADVPEGITPESLTSHTSGLPRIHVPIWKALINPLPEDPYANFSRSDLLAWIRDWNGQKPISKRRHAYSNLGVGLLGEAMSLREGKSFVDLLTEKVIAPMGLGDTTDQLNEIQKRQFVMPRDTKGKTVLPWTFQSMAAAGCLRSSARDLAQFADGVIQAFNNPKTALHRAICRSTQPIIGLGPKGKTVPAAQCSGWLSMAFDKDESRFFYHDGGTAGSTCAIYICPAKGEACGIVSNNGVAANLWASARLSWSNQLRQAHNLFTAT